MYTHRKNPVCLFISFRQLLSWGWHMGHFCRYGFFLNIKDQSYNVRLCELHCVLLTYFAVNISRISFPGAVRYETDFFSYLTENKLTNYKVYTVCNKEFMLKKFIHNNIYSFENLYIRFFTHSKICT